MVYQPWYERMAEISSPQEREAYMRSVFGGQNTHHQSSGNGGQVFLGKQLPGGWVAGGSTSAGSILGPIFMLILLPFIAGQWIVQRYGWAALIAIILALVAVVFWMARTRPGRVTAGVLGRFFVALIATFVGGGLLYLLWQFAGTILS